MCVFGGRKLSTNGTELRLLVQSLRVTQRAFTHCGRTIDRVLHLGGVDRGGSTMFPCTYAPRYRCSPNLCSPVPMFPGTDVPRYLCSPVPMFPGTYVLRYLCSPVPMFPGTYVPRNLCSPVPMFPGTCVPRYLCSPVPMFPDLLQMC